MAKECVHICVTNFGERNNGTANVNSRCKSLTASRSAIRSEYSFECKFLSAMSCFDKRLLTTTFIILHTT